MGITASRLQQEPSSEAVASPRLSSKTEWSSPLPNTFSDFHSPPVPNDMVVRTLKLPGEDACPEGSLARHIWPQVLSFYSVVNQRFEELFAQPSVNHGPHLIQRAVDPEVFAHFTRTRREQWAKFGQDASTGDVWYYGDPSHVHEIVNELLFDHIQGLIEARLEHLPLCPPALEAELQYSMQSPVARSRGAAAYRLLFQNAGAKAMQVYTKREERLYARPRAAHPPRGDRADRTIGGVKEADSLVLCAGDTTLPLLALEVAFTNESLLETALETWLWCLQESIGIGLKIDSTSTRNKLDPMAMLFVAARADGTADELVQGNFAKQFPVGRGSRVKLDKDSIGFARHHKLRDDPVHLDLYNSIDWSGGSDLRSNSPWDRQYDVFTLDRDSKGVQIPLSHALQDALSTKLCGPAPAQAGLAEAYTTKQHASRLTYSRELERFCLNLSIDLQFATIRSFILTACLQKAQEDEADLNLQARGSEDDLRVATMADPHQSVQVTDDRALNKEETGTQSRLSPSEASKVAEGVKKLKASRKKRMAKAFKNVFGKRRKK